MVQLCPVGLGERLLWVGESVRRRELVDVCHTILHRGCGVLLWAVGQAVAVEAAEAQYLREEAAAGFALGDACLDDAVMVEVCVRPG